MQHDRLGSVPPLASAPSQRHRKERSPTMQMPAPNVQTRRLHTSIAAALVAVMVCGCSLLPVATASAKTPSTLIVVNEGIGSVHIGQTPAQVEQEVGTPTSKQASSSSANWYYDNKPPFAEIVFGTDKRVTFLAPNSTRDKTSKGIGEGSSKAQVRAAYPKAKCAPQPGPGGKTDLTCDISKKLAGGTTIETSFTFNTANGSGGVNEVDISES